MTVWLNRATSLIALQERLLIVLFLLGSRLLKWWQARASFLLDLVWRSRQVCRKVVFVSRDLVIISRAVEGHQSLILLHFLKSIWIWRWRHELLRRRLVHMAVATDVCKVQILSVSKLYVGRVLASVLHRLVKIVAVVLRYVLWQEMCGLLLLVIVGSILEEATRLLATLIAKVWLLDRHALLSQVRWILMACNDIVGCTHWHRRKHFV